MLGPLRSLKILDFTRLLPGPLATNLLCRLGANVVKVDGKGAGSDYVRHIAPLLDFSDSSDGGRKKRHGALYENLNAGKREIVLDIKHQECKDIICKLISTYDIIIEGNRPGVFDKLGIGYDALSKINPRLIYCSLTGYGSTGPYKHKAGHDINYLANAGVLGLTKNSDSQDPETHRPPVLGFQAADATGALHAVIGILTAVIDRGANNTGQYIDVSLMESSMTLAMPTLASILNATPTPSGNIDSAFKPGMGMLDGGLPNYNIYETKDNKYVCVGSLEEHFWKSICTHTNRLDLVDCKDISIVQSFFKSKTLQEWLTINEHLDVCLDKIFEPKEIMSHSQHIDRKTIVTDKFGHKQIALGPRLPNYPVDVLPTAHRYGEDTYTVLKEIGCIDSDIHNWHKKEIIFCSGL